MNLLNTIAANIKKYRLAQGLTQESLGWKAKLHPNYIGRVERGEDNISAISLEKIAKALKIDAYRLLMRE